MRAVHQNPKGAKLGALAVDVRGVPVHELTVPGCPEARGVGPAATKKQRIIKREDRRVSCVGKDPQRRGVTGKAFLPADPTPEAALLQLKYWSQRHTGTLRCPPSRNKSPGRGQNPPPSQCCPGRQPLMARKTWRMRRCLGKAAQRQWPHHAQLTGWSGSTGHREVCSCWLSPAGEIPAREGCPGAPAGRCDC